MKKNIIFSIIILIVVAAGVYAYLTKQPSVPPAVTEVTVPIELEYDLKTIERAHSGKDNRDTYSISIEYPVITSGIEMEALSRINQSIKEAAENSANAAEGSFKENMEGTLPAYIPAEPSKQEGDAKIIADLGSLPIINVEFNSYTYSGGAHGISVRETFIFDAKNGERLTSEDIFRGNYLEKLSALSLTELKSEDPHASKYTFAEEGTKPDPDNFKVFTVQPNGFHIIFGDYQVGPYTIGTTEIVLPFSSLEANLTSRFKEILSNTK